MTLDDSFPGDIGPRPLRGAALRDLTREDLSLYAVAELKERIETLEGEIARARAAMDGKQSTKSAADALFSFKS